MAVTPPKFRILQVRISPVDAGTNVAVEYGLTEIVRTIPQNQGLVRLSAVFNDKGELGDVEIVTDRI